MKCKIFTSKDGYLLQNMGATPILLEDVINNYFKSITQKVDIIEILQSQS